MKYDYLKEIPVKERRSMLAPDWNSKYFKGYCIISILIIAGISLVNGFLAISFDRGAFEVIFCNIIGLPFALIVHLSIFSGFISSNTGSYFRETEPIRYWTTIGFPFMGFVFTQIAIWYL